METLTSIKRRKSTRSFKADQIPEEQLNTVLAAGCAAPVGMARYGDLHFTVIQDKEALKAVSEGVGKIFHTDQDMIYGAPTLILLSSKSEAVPGLNGINAGCVLENMAVAATDLGLGNCILGGPGPAINADPALREKTGLPEGCTVLGSIALGFASVPNDSEKEFKITISMNRV